MKKMIFLLLLLCGGGLTSLRAVNYYWVGDSGNWNDLSHWSLVSGSTSITDRPTVLPGPDDDVFFNDASFTMPGQTVTLAIGSGQNVCKNMIWQINTGENHILHFPQMATLNVYGKLDLDKDMSVTYFDLNSAHIKMLSTANPTQGFFVAGNTVPNVEFAGVGGSWGITGDVSVDGNLTVTAGELKAGGAASQRFDLLVDRFIVNGANAEADLRRLDIIANTQFCVIAVKTFTADGSTLTTPHLKVASVNAVEFGALTLTGTSAQIDASGYALTFNGDVTLNAERNTILGDNTFEADLILNHPGSEVLLEADATQTLMRQQDLIVNAGGCTGYITLRSTEPGTAAHITRIPQNPADAVTVMRLNVQDIHVNTGTGNPAFTASISFDLGNNMGWVFAEPLGTTYYWVNGSGNWSQGSHWSFTSGGSPVSCIPTAADNVVFDDASFTAADQTVTLDFAATYFNSMTWNVSDVLSPEMVIPTGDVYIGGSLTLSEFMALTLQDSSTVFNFISDGLLGIPIISETITSADHNLANVNFSGSGEWTLQDELTASKSFTITNGNFSTGNNYNMHLGDVLIDGSNVQLTLNNSEIFTPHFRLVDIGDLIEGISNIYTALFEVIPAGVEFRELTLRGTNGKLIGTDLIFYDVKLSSSALSQVFGSHTYSNELQFDNPGMIVEFEAGSTQQVKRINSLGESCNDQIYVRSTTSGSTFSFVALPGAPATISVDYVWLQDNIASGTTFEANFSLNLGNVTGWTFANGETPKNFYWIGGSGNWSDPDHWSMATGGDPSGCIPSPADNVFFDANSAGTAARGTVPWTVTLDLKEQYAHDMTWMNVTEMPTLLLPAGNKLCLFGSLILDPNMTLNFSGDTKAGLCFQATQPGKKITTNGLAVQNMFFQGNGGRWTLEENLPNVNVNVPEAITITDGILDTNGEAVNTKRIVVNGPTAGLNLGNSILTITEKLQILNIGSLIPDFSEIRTPMIQETVAAPLNFYEVRMMSDLGETTIDADGLIFQNLILMAVLNNIHGSHEYTGNLIFSGSQFSFYKFDPGATQTLTGGLLNTSMSNGGSPVTAVVQSTSETVNTIFTKPSGSVCLENAVINNITATGGANFGYIIANSTASNSPGWFGSSLMSCALFLPVECVEFTAEIAGGNDVALSWITAQEVNNLGFELQRSSDGRHFETIAWIKGAGTTAEAQQYFYLDREAGPGSEVYYRLQQIDADGTVSDACDIVAVSLKPQQKGVLALYPNPAGEYVRLQYRSDVATQALVRIYDPAGRLLLERDWQMLPGDNQLDLDLAELPAGLYEVVWMPAAGAERIAKRLVVLDN